MRDISCLSETSECLLKSPTAGVKDWVKVKSALIALKFWLWTHFWSFQYQWILCQVGLSCWDIDLKVLTEALELRYGHLGVVNP